MTLDRGVTDEGEPWFVFCRAEDDEVIVHFARIDGKYLISAPSFGGNVTGYDFRALVRDLVARNPVLRPTRRDENVTLHPSALLVMLVASALLKMMHSAEAATDRSAGVPAGTEAAPVRIVIGGVEHIADLVALETQQYATLLSAVALASGSLDSPSMPMFVISAPAHEQALPVHMAVALPVLAADWGVHLAMSGAGSVAPAVAAPALVMSPLAEMVVVHNHDISVSQMQPALAGGGATIASADPVAAPPQTAPPAAAPVVPSGDASAVPVTNASALIQGNHDLANSLLQIFGGNQPIAYDATIPAAFITPLNSGVHTPAATLAAGSHSGGHSSAAVPAADASLGAFGSGGTVPSVAPSAADASHSAVLASSSTAAGLPGPGSAEFAAVLTIMQNFAQVVGSHLAILVSGNQVIEYDYFAIDYTPTAVSAVTYDFADGVHVSLVGLPSELPHTSV